MSGFDENAWWGDCANTFHEEEKQFACATRMGLRANWNCGHPPTYDLGGRSILDVGGGPVSMLLKCVGFDRAVVADPGEFPAWVNERYREHGVEYMRIRGEDLRPAHGPFDEVWIYNVLQHVDDPARVVAKAYKLADTIRLFEWIDIEPYPGHPHMLTQELLDKWLRLPGFTANVDERGAVGRAYYGVFRPTVESVE